MSEVWAGCPNLGHTTLWLPMRKHGCCQRALLIWKVHSSILSFFSSCSTPLIRGIHRGVVRAQGESSILSFSCSTPLIRDILRGVVHSTKGVNNFFFLSHVQLHYSGAIDINLDHSIWVSHKKFWICTAFKIWILDPEFGSAYKNSGSSSPLSVHCNL